MNSILLNTATNLNNIRKALGLTIEELSELISVSDRHVRRYLKDGINSLPTLVNIANILKVDVLEFFKEPEIIN